MHKNDTEYVQALADGPAIDRYPQSDVRRLRMMLVGHVRCRSTDECRLQTMLVGH